MRNPYKRLMDLLPDRPLQVGEVIDVDGGVATIELAGGGIATARGTASIGQQVFFRDQNIEGPAPSLIVEDISI